MCIYTLNDSITKLCKPAGIVMCTPITHNQINHVVNPIGEVSKM